MILTDNVKWLRTKFPLLLKALEKSESMFVNEPFETTDSKSGATTIKWVKDGKSMYLHSQYDPIHEAGVVLEQFAEQLESHDLIFFYGAGLGYHISSFSQQYPNKAFAVYEPIPAVAHHLLANRSLSEWNVLQLKEIMVEWSEDVRNITVRNFVQKYGRQKILFVVLPSYGRLFPEKLEGFREAFSKSIRSVKEGFRVNSKFETYWTINCLFNFQTLLNTPNFMTKRDCFVGKPAIIVSAGPSLEDEFDNLRSIKKQGSAYIFAVGSANKALIAQGIKPDAVVSYDPETGFNGLDVYKEIIENQIHDIPLVFGSTLGFLTVRDYPGPRNHFFINQDTLSPYLLDGQVEKEHIIRDAPSIANVTFELLAKMGCNPIVFVGQNFGYRGKQYYTKGISYSTRPTEMLAVEEKNLVETPSVDGGVVLANAGHLTQKAIMEKYISEFPSIEVINTTQGGALIQGTAFQALKELIAERLCDRVVIDGWAEGEDQRYRFSEVMGRLETLHDQKEEFATQYEKAVSVLAKLNQLMKTRDTKQFSKVFTSFDKAFKKLEENLYYKILISPTVRTQRHLLQSQILDIRETTDLMRKANKVFENFGKFLVACQERYNFLNDPYLAFRDELLTKHNENSISI